ncbi:MAG: hypothetical protein WD969_12685 [Paracoccaceae bacterium]
MRGWKLTCAAIGAAMTLGACSTDPDEVSAGLATLPPKVSVVAIETLELGRLYEGYMLTAFATAPGAGYYQPELRIRYGGRQAVDGFYEYDFLVLPPENPSEFANAPVAARQVRADIELPVDMLRGAAGVRVWSDRDSVEGRF